MIQRCLLAMICGLALWAVPAQLHAADLASARTLYASASYEEALEMLATIETPENLEPVNQMRALCFLALGRTREAEQAIERIVLHNPGYMMETAEVSPKVVSLFRTVRQQTLPTIARSLYAQAKTSFDEKRWDAATNEFTRMLAIVNDPGLVEQRATLTDLRQLGEGFLKLSEAQVAMAAKAPPALSATPAAPATVTAGASTPRPDAAKPSAAPPAGVPAGRTDRQRTERPASAAVDTTIYSAQNTDVVPPIELQRAMPRWSPVDRVIAQATYRGLIEIVIDERGAVESAKMAKSVTPLYDDLLLQSARNWRYTPAKKEGRAVRYRQVLEILLRPSQED